MLELLPGLGKKTMWAILEERKKGVFKSFQDLDQRVPSIHHPEKLVAKRIEMEISDPNQKNRLVVARSDAGFPISASISLQSRAHGPSLFRQPWCSYWSVLRI